MRLRTKKSLKNQAYRDLYAVSDIVFTTAKVASLNVMIFISLFCGPNNMKFRYSIDLHCSQVILQTMNAVYWLYTTITKHSKKVDCQSKLLQKENQPELHLYNPQKWHLSPLKKTYVSWEAVHFHKGWGFKHFITTV